MRRTPDAFKLATNLSATVAIGDCSSYRGALVRPASLSWTKIDGPHSAAVAPLAEGERDGGHDDVALAPQPAPHARLEVLVKQSVHRLLEDELAEHHGEGQVGPLAMQVLDVAQQRDHDRAVRRDDHL